ncbi:MAG: hypothetical protein H0V49_02020 [Nocardioidaceae bacterium]|nr:hypothetical protein [Nocardioidaceae bacterium]
MTGRHRADPTSLVFGVVFGGFALAWLLRTLNILDFDQVWLAAPLILIAAGALGLILAIRGDRRYDSP